MQACNVCTNKHASAVLHLGGHNNNTTHQAHSAPPPPRRFGNSGHHPALTLHCRVFGPRPQSTQASAVRGSRCGVRQGWGGGCNRSFQCRVTSPALHTLAKASATPSRADSSTSRLLATVTASRRSIKAAFMAASAALRDAKGAHCMTPAAARDRLRSTPQPAHPAATPQQGCAKPGYQKPPTMHDEVRHR
jgi:hypothetical protein